MNLTGITSMLLLVSGGSAFTLLQQTSSRSSSTSMLHMGMFDGFKGMGSGKDDLDEQWERQQEILKNRRKPQAEREQYFNKVAQRRAEATAKQEQMWAWQKKSYAKGEDPLDEWKKRRADGSISDLDNQYDDPKKIGGIPLPMASFGVGGEFGLGGKFDNGGRFDLRLPYAEQGYVDDDSDVMGKLSSFFGGKKGKKVTPPPQKEEPQKKKTWPW